MSKKRKKKLSPFNLIINLIIVAVAVIAIQEQLSRPAEERTWQGKVFGIPYNFRLPTVDSVRLSFWNTESTQIFVPHAFGIGWSINFYPLLHPQTNA